MNLANKLIRIGESESAGNQSLMQIITSLGLTSGLKLCLDAGDAASYNPGVQTDKWLDTSGNGHDFFRGTGTGSDTYDPTFNGSAGGLSSSEYFSCDGNDFFNYDSAIETWMNNLHKDNAKFSMLAVFYSPPTGSVRLGVTANISINNPGILLNHSSAGAFQFQVGRSGSNQQIFLSTATANRSAWNIWGVTVDEPGNSYAININGTQESGACTYTTPSTSDAGGFSLGTTPVGSTGSGQSASGTRYACYAFWEGVALTSQNIADIRNAIKGRFGL